MHFTTKASEKTGLTAEQSKLEVGAGAGRFPCRAQSEGRDHNSLRPT